MSHSSRLADRLRRKTGEDMYNEIKSAFDQDPMNFFGWNSPHNSQPFARSGFPFDEDVYSRRQDIRSHLDDLAQRHPEFADQLRGPPWGSEAGSPSSHGTWGRKRRGSGEEESQSQASGSSGEARSQQPPEESAVPRGRPRQGPIPQYGLRNTVDLGQQQAQGMSEQEDRDGSRGQRSWSAPPDNRTAGAEQQAPQQQQPQQRFVSRINITPSSPGKPPPAPQKQPQQTSSNVRHIPIFVEGRDEPLLPKHAEEPEQIFTQRVPPQPQQTFGFSQPQTFTTQHIPVQRQPPQQQHYQQQPPKPQQQHHQQQPPKPQQQAKPQPVFTDSRGGVHEERVPAQKIPVQQQQKPTEQVSPNDPICRVQMVQKDVENLQQLVEKYSGSSRQEKDYVYLDEMLTRNLLKLDDIETEGKENVRQARKDVIKNIQRCISILESKVPLPEDQSKEASGDAELPMEDGEAPPAMEAEAAPEKMEEDEAKGEAGDVDMKEGPANAEENVTAEGNQQEEKMEVAQPSDAAAEPSEPVNMESEAVQIETPAQENNDGSNAATGQPTDIESEPQNPVAEVSVPQAEVPTQDSGDSGTTTAAPVAESTDGAAVVVSEAGDKEQLKVEADPKKKRTGKKSKSPVKKGAKVAENKQENEVEKG